MKIRNAYEKNFIPVIAVCYIVYSRVRNPQAQYSRPDVLDG